MKRTKYERNFSLVLVVLWTTTKVISDPLELSSHVFIWPFALFQMFQVCLPFFFGQGSAELHTKGSPSTTFMQACVELTNQQSVSRIAEVLTVPWLGNEQMQAEWGVSGDTVVISRWSRPSVMIERDYFSMGLFIGKILHGIPCFVRAR